MPKKTGLGKGLDALFGPVPEEEKVDEEGLEAIVRAVVETMLAAKKLDK